MNLGGAIVRIDNRQIYSETRYRALGSIFGRIYAMAFTYRGDRLRIISLRKANKREVKHYEREKTQSEIG